MGEPLNITAISTLIHELVGKSGRGRKFADIAPALVGLCASGLVGSNSLQDAATAKTLLSYACLVLISGLAGRALMMLLHLGPGCTGVTLTEIRTRIGEMFGYTSDQTYRKHHEKGDLQRLALELYGLQSVTKSDLSMMQEKVGCCLSEWREEIEEARKAGYR